jgi:hypothetical protein
VKSACVGRDKNEDDFVWMGASARRKHTICFLAIIGPMTGGADQDRVRYIYARIFVSIVLSNRYQK